MVTIPSSVKSNLLALQTISAEAGKSQSILSTGKKVNSALDNATSFFTASSLNSRAASLTGLLDSVSNGIQTIKAADSGISSISKLVDQLKSTARSALSATTAYTSKASATSAVIAGATASDLRGSAANTRATTGAGTALQTPAVAAANVTGTTNINEPGLGLVAGDTLSVGGSTITITAAGSGASDASNVRADADLSELLTKVGNAQGTGATASVTNGAITITAGNTTDSIVLSGSAATKLGLTAGTTAPGAGPAAATVTGTQRQTPAVAAAAKTGASALNSTGIGLASGETISVNGSTINITAAGSGASDADNIRADDTVDNMLSKIAAKAGTGATAAINAQGQITVTAGDSTTSLALGGTGLSKLGLTAGTSAPTTSTSSLNGRSLTFTVGSGNDAKTTTVNFGDPSGGTGAVKSLDDLNAKLSDVGLSASLDSGGKLTFTTTSETASKSFTVSSDSADSATASGFATGGTGSASTTPVRGGTGADSRDSLVTQYNGLLDQINTIAKDSSYNGLNLLTGDTLSLVFNETNSSKLSITGQDASFTGLGLQKAVASDFNDGGGINAVLAKLEESKGSLNTLSSKLGANLAVVQTRQDFTKNISNALTTGADNLVNADMNEEATKLLALQTSQQLAQSALSLANQSAQGVLRLIQ